MVLFQSCSPPAVRSARATHISTRIPPSPPPLHRARHPEELEMKAGICVGGQAATRNACLLLLCRQRKRVGNATNEHDCAESTSVVGLSLPVISKTTFERHRRQKLSNNITQNKGAWGASTILRSVLLTARWAEQNVTLVICLP